MFQVFTSGNMSSMPLEEAIEWRGEVKYKLARYCDSKGCAYKLSELFVVNPPRKFNYTQKLHKTERQIMEYELNMVRRSNVVLVNFKNFKSLGTMAELAVAYENRIPIVGFNPENEEIHPWQEEMCQVIFDSLEEAVDYIFDYYMVDR